MRQLREWQVVALALSNLGEAAADEGHLETAIELIDEAARIHAEIGDTGRHALELVMRGRELLQQHRRGDAASSFAAALAVGELIPQRDIAALALVGAADVVGARDVTVAARLAGAADALMDALGAEWTVVTRATERSART